MNREIKLSLLSITGIIFVVGTIFLLGSDYSSYAILTATVAVILVAYAVIYYNESKDNYSIYRNKLRRIINTYDSILVKSEKLPELADHNIIRVASMEDLVYAQMVIKKPIYFYEEEKSCSFVLIDDKEICVYIVKANNDDITATEILIDEIRRQPTKINIDHSILDDIENTTIIKLDNCKTYKVSPVRPKKEKEYIKDITQVFEAINYKNAEIKEDVFIEIEPKKKKKNKEEQKVNLTEVEEKIDELVELSNTKVLDIIELEPVDTDSVKKVEEKKEQEKEEKATKQKKKKNNKKNNSKTNQKQATNKK
ncbi:MAG: DUF5305 family protein [Candidatus Coprovivens sp.]